MSVLRMLWVGAGPGVRAGLAMPGPVCLNFPLGLMMASGMKVAERGQSSRDTGPGWGMSSYSVQRGGSSHRCGPGQARLHLIDNSFPRGSARPGPPGSGHTPHTGSGAARGQECSELRARLLGSVVQCPPRARDHSEQPPVLSPQVSPVSRGHSEMTTLCYRQVVTSPERTEASHVTRLCLCPGPPSSSAGQ